MNLRAVMNQCFADSEQMDNGLEKKSSFEEAYLLAPD